MPQRMNSSVFFYTLKSVKLSNQWNVKISKGNGEIINNFWCSIYTNLLAFFGPSTMHLVCATRFISSWVLLNTTAISFALQWSHRAERISLSDRKQFHSGVLSINLSFIFCSMQISKPFHQLLYFLAAVAAKDSASKHIRLAFKGVLPGTNWASFQASNMTPTEHSQISMPKITVLVVSKSS